MFCFCKSFEILTQGIKPANSIFRYAIYMSYDTAGSLLAAVWCRLRMKAVNAC